MTCTTPTRPGAMPENEIGAETPPTDTPRFCVTRGSAEIAVCEDGVPPVATDGETSPPPVKYSEMVWPIRADADGARAPLWSVKMPGATAAIEIGCDVTWPLLSTLRVAFVPPGMPYGIWRFNCPGEE